MDSHSPGRSHAEASGPGRLADTLHRPAQEKHDVKESKRNDRLTRPRWGVTNDEHIRRRPSGDFSNVDEKIPRAFCSSVTRNGRAWIRPPRRVRRRCRESYSDDRSDNPSPETIQVVWGAPGDTDTLNSYRVMWAPEGQSHSYSEANTDTGGNAYPPAAPPDVLSRCDLQADHRGGVARQGRDPSRGRAGLADPRRDVDKLTAAVRVQIEALADIRARHHPEDYEQDPIYLSALDLLREFKADLDRLSLQGELPGLDGQVAPGPRLTVS